MPTSPGPIAHVPLLHKKLLVSIAGGEVVALAGATKLNPVETNAPSINRILNRHPMMPSPGAADPVTGRDNTLGHRLNYE
jgi:hypothetical protein